MTSTQGAAAAGSAIERARKQGGRGLRELARAADISPGYLSRVETGQVLPSEWILGRIAEELERPPMMLSALGGYLDMSWVLGFAAEALHLSAEESEQLEEGELASQIDAVTRAFLWANRSQVLTSLGFPDAVEVQIPGLTPERQRAVEAFVDEQRVLSDMDRRGSNPARMRLEGRFADPVMEGHHQQVKTQLSGQGSDE